MENYKLGRAGLGGFAPIIALLRILFQNGGGAERKDQSIFHAAEQRKTHSVAAALASGEAAVLDQRRRMHKPVRMVLHTVGTTCRNKLTWLERQLIQ